MRRQQECEGELCEGEFAGLAFSSAACEIPSMDQTTPITSPSGRRQKGTLRKLQKLKNPQNSPSDPRSGRVTLTTPFRDLAALDLIVDFVSKQDPPPPRINRSTIIRALIRFTREQLSPMGDEVQSVLGKNVLSALQVHLVDIDAESFR